MNAVTAQLEQLWVAHLAMDPAQAGDRLAQIPAGSLTAEGPRAIAEQIALWVQARTPWQFTDLLTAVPSVGVALMDWMRIALEATSLPDLLAPQLADWIYRDQVRSTLRHAIALDREGEDPSPWVTQQLAALEHQRRGDAAGIVESAAATADFGAWLERRADPTRTQILGTPWPLLTQRGGGLAPEDLVVIAGRPGDGKTTLALSIASFVARVHRVPVLYLSYEMGHERLLTQVAGQEWALDRYRATHGQLSDREWEHLATNQPQMAEWPLWWWRQGRRPDWPTAAAEIQKLRRRTRPVGLVVVDYLELVPRPKKTGKAEEVGDIIEAIKASAIEWQIPIIVCQQEDRAVEKERRAPQLSDLRWSGDIEQAADKVWMLQRMTPPPEPGLPETGLRPAASETPVRLWIRKHRDGPLGVIDFRFDGAHSTFREADEQPQGGVR